MKKSLKESIALPARRKGSRYTVLKKSCFILLAVCLLAFGAAAAFADSTILVYLCGTDLQEEACEDLVEMAEVEAGDAINLVVLAGGAEEWALEDLQGHSRTLAVIRDGYFESLDDWGHQSMGSAESLSEFLRYGLTEYPADRVIVILWDHGAGSAGGICFDETADDDGLTLSEMDEALSGLVAAVPDTHIDIFGCDACMMASYEMAAMLSRYPVDCFVASEELEPGSGWYYTEWMNTLKNDPSISNEDLCREIVDSFMAAGLENDPEDCLTLSAVRLSEIRPLEICMERFAGVLSDQIRGGNLSSVRRGRSRMYTFGSFADGSWDMVDLGSALDTYAQFDPENAAEARKLLAAAVIVSRQTENLSPCSGLSVLIPQDTADSFDAFREGFSLSGIIPKWVDFVTAYAAELSGGSYHFSASAAVPVSSDSVLPESFVSFSGPLFGWMRWDEGSSGYQEEDVEEVSVSDSAQGFTAVLPQEDLAYLDSVEGMLLMDISEDGSEAYVDFGTMQNNLIDWQTGTVVSLYDGLWPVFGGQPVPLYDQTANGYSRRSLIPVKLNGAYTYLVVLFPAGETEGRVLGANAGYDDNGLPIRHMTGLKPGDEIIPVYTLYYAEEGQEDLQEAEFEGEAVLWEEGMTVSYEDLSDAEDPVEMLFCFVFYDIFGDDTLSELVSFAL